MPDRQEQTEHCGTPLLPAERMCLTIAQAQLQRGENPPINTTTVLVMALERVTEQAEVCRRIVSAQAEDEALWCPVTATEAYAVQELRTLHRAVEGDLAAVAAIEDC